VDYHWTLDKIWPQAIPPIRTKKVLLRGGWPAAKFCPKSSYHEESDLCVLYFSLFFWGCFFATDAFSDVFAKGKYVHIEQLKDMFEDMVVKKDISKVPMYYHRDFLLYTNGQEINYKEFLESHAKYYATPIKYEIEYDEDTFLEQGEKLAGRIWITTSRPNESPKKIEVILIAEFKDNKIYRLWELTYPDWSKLPAFKE
jgi:hypothetical protein